MAHFCGFTKLIFLLLMLARIPFNATRPLKGKSQTTSDLIAGNEFLKLFLEHDQLDKGLFNSDYGGGGGNAGESQTEFDKKSAETGSRASAGRSLRDKGPKQNQAEGQLENSKQVVKLVTSGSKIVFLEDYDENDAILDAEARDIDLKRETFKLKPQHGNIEPNLDEFKVVAVSVSSSSQRGSAIARNRFSTTTTTTTTSTSKPTAKTTKYNKSYTTGKPIVTMTSKPPTATATVMPTQKTSKRSDSLAAENFINRSHKSELSIEEVEPLTITQQQKSRKLYSRHRTFPLSSVADTLESIDSENSASTNIHNILAAPLAQAASARSTSTVTSTYHSSQHNVSINHDSNLHASKTHKTVDDNSEHIEMPSTSSQEQAPQATGGGSGVQDQLLPFQTVIYHDTKAGHGPQSRSISYSSISQNVEDLKKWHQSGILAEARRNVSESLNPMSLPTETPSNHQSEPAKFYSQPSKMYSEPSKFYSEPSKVYSEPSKMYGEPEKIYSEPAKNYGQPSKIYSEPSKVYSQPSKVYSEPAKTYWPLLTGLTTTPTSSSFITTTITPTANSLQITTILPPANNVYQSSRRPAIVSRIAFGENHSTTTTTTTPPPNATTAKSYGSHIQHHHSRTYGHNRYHPSSSSSADTANNENSSSSTPSRRIVFNLDRLPYDLLNAPEPSNQQQTLLEPQKSKIPQQTLTYQQQHHHINPCLESAVTSLFASATLSAHPALQKQRQQQHSSLSDQQHSNQNANGLPNGDLVKCVAEISHTSSSSSSAAAVSNDGNDDEVESYTTERSHTDELYSSTPEQNYKIEESVSGMTNGRAHDGIHSADAGRNSLALPTTSPIHQQQHHGFKPIRQRTRIHNPVEMVNGVSGSSAGVHGGHHFSQPSYNTNANVNVQNNNRNTNVGNDNPDYSNYDDGNNEDGNGGDDYDGSSKNNDYENDDEDSNKNIHHQSNAADGRGSIPANNGNNDDDDDSKVAYVVEGRNYRKYRVEEKTDDGFIVGEYGVVDHNDGNLRGVRYTADSTINRSLIQKALLTFLKLK